jgi:hypothetical protein
LKRGSELSGGLILFSCSSQSIALYAVIAVIAALLVVVSTALHALSCVCGAVVRCRRPQAGASSIAPAKARTDLQSATWMSATLSLLLVVVLAALIILAYTYGMSDAFGAVSAVPDAPLGLARMVYGVGLATQPALVTAVSAVLLPTLRKANATICDAVHLDGVIRDLGRLNNSFENIPDLHNIIDTIDQIQNTTDGISAQLDGIFVFSEDFTRQKHIIKNASDAILSDLRDVNASLVMINKATDDAYGSVMQLDNYMYVLFGPGGPSNHSSTDRDGYIDAVEYDLVRTQRSDTPGDGIPTEDTLNSAATGDRASLARLISGSLYGERGELTELIAKLQGIYESVVRMPDYERTGENLRHINETLREILAPHGVAAQLPEQFNRLRTAVQSVPRPALIKQHVRAIFDAVNGIGAAPLVQLLARTDALLRQIPGHIEDILNTIDRVVKVLNSVRAPVHDLVFVHPRKFEQTIMDLPFNATEVYDKVGDALNDAIGSADAVTPDLRELNSTLLQDANIPSFIEQINEAQNLYDEKLGAVNQTQLYALLDLAAGFNMTYNTTPFEIQLVGVRAAVAAVYIPPEVLLGLEALQAVRMALEQALRDVVGHVGDVGSDGTVTAREGDYRMLVQGVCANDMVTYCTSDSDCAAPGTCSSIAYYRCSANAAAPQFCVQDGDCTAGSYCLADGNRALNLQAALLALAQPEASDFGQQQVYDEFENVRSSAGAVDMTDMHDQLDAFMHDLHTLNTVQYEQDISTLQGELFNPAYSLDQYLGDLQAAQDRIRGVNYTDYAVEVHGAQQEVEDAKTKYGDQLAEYTDLTQDLRNFFFGRTELRAHLHSIGRDRLEHMMGSGGMGPVVVHVGRSLQETANQVINIVKNASIAEDVDLETVQIAEQLHEPAVYLDRVTANPHSGYFNLHKAGALYYMMQLTNETADMVVNANDTTQHTVLKDSSGRAYPDGKFCVTNTCFENQQQEAEDDYGVYLPLLLIPLAAVALIALGSFGCVFVSPKSGGCCRRCMPHWLICTLVVLVPLYLILSGLLFTVMIGVTDSCSSTPRIAANYLSAYGDDLCVKLGGNGTLSECTVSSNNVTVSMNLRRMAHTALGMQDCPADKADDPFGQPLNSVASQLNAVATSRVQQELEKKAYRRLRTLPRDIALDFAGNLAHVGRDFLVDVASDAVTCEQAQDVVEYLTAPVCTSVVGPWTWIVAAIYAAAWVMLCLGFPAACALKQSFEWEHEAALRTERGPDSPCMHRNLHLHHMMATRGRGTMVGRGPSPPKRSQRAGRSVEEESNVENPLVLRAVGANADAGTGTGASAPEVEEQAAPGSAHEEVENPVVRMAEDATAPHGAQDGDSV